MALTADQVAWQDCLAFVHGQALPATPQTTLAPWLGLAQPTETPAARWTTGPVASEVRHFRIVFKQPIAAGTLCCPAEMVSILRPEAALPGDVTDEKQWEPLARRRVRTLNPAQPIRAIRVTLQFHNLPWEAQLASSEFPGLWLLTGKYFSPADSGYQRWSPAVQVTPDSPKQLQWLGYWPEPLVISSLLVASPDKTPVSISTLPAEATEHPRSAPSAAWKATTGEQVGPLHQLTQAQPTRALRILKPESTDKNQARQSPPQVFALAALDEKATLPAQGNYSFIPPSPVALDYEMPLSGFAAIRIEDSKGQHVRRLIAEVERAGGPVHEAWDLLDDQGRYVVPGEYRFVGLARPALKLTYEGTVYSAGNPPWMAPVPGGGWWMADHSPPVSACAVGEVMFFGAMGAEFGTPLIATDRSGKKLWHHLHQSAKRFVSDGRYAFVVNDEAVYRIDPQQNFKLETLHKFAYSDLLPGHSDGYNYAETSGAATNGQQLCVSYSALSPPWITSTFKAGEMDLARSVPKPVPAKVHETALTPNERVLSTFLTMTSSTAASFGPGEKKGPLKNMLLVALTKEVPVGSIVLPRGDLEVYALRSGKKLPPQFIPSALPNDPLAKATDSLGDDFLDDLAVKFDPQVWIALKGNSGNRPGIVVPESGMMTKLLVFTAPELEKLDYSLVLDRRYADATPQAKFLTLEGKPTKAGGWDFQRKASRPISYADPAVSAFVWDKSVELRGFMLTRPLEWSGIAIDLWTGPTDATIDAEALRDNSLWKQVHLHRQTRNHVKFNWHTDKVITGDFGAVLPTRALRIRVVDPPQGPGSPENGFVSGGFESLITFTPLGNDAPLPKDLAQRVTVLQLPAAGQAATGQAAAEPKHLPLPHPSAMAFDRAGKLYIACDDGICQLTSLSPEGAAARKVILPRTACERPRALAFDSAGLLYVLDGKTQCVLVFDPQTGAKLRSIGHGGSKLGPYDPEELSNPFALSIDQQDCLWLVEQNFQPKRISRWSPKGEVELQLFGPTHYGGGGMLDPGDKTVINHLGMKFRTGFKTRTWKLESRLAHYGTWHYMPDRVVYVGGKRFLIGDRPVVTPFGDAGPTSVICEEIKGEAVPRVASGILGDWREFAKNVPLQAAAKGLDPSHTGFVWSDLNADRQVQTAEVQFVPGLRSPRAPFIGDDLSLNFCQSQGGQRLRTQEMVTVDQQANIPRYDLARLEQLEELTEEVMVNSAGETFVMTHKLLDSSGKRLWTYPDHYRGVQASNMVPWGFTQRPAGVLCGGFGTIGNFEIAGERLFCVGGNNGDYYAFTHDGLLAAAVLGGPVGYGLRYFSVPECIPGKTDLTDLRKTVEDFHGHITRAEDGNVYAIAGKNHVTMIRVDGLEKMQRFSGAVSVSADQLQQTQKWANRKAQIERFLDQGGPKRYQVAFAKKQIEIDGNILTDWPAGEPVTIHETFSATGDISLQWQAQLAFDANNLYIGGTAIDSTPLVNNAEDPQVAFQHGDALDIQIGLDPTAPANRTEAVPGDIRLLLTYRGDEPLVMLYRYLPDPGSASKSDTARVFRSPVGETSVAEILQLTNAKVSVQRSDRRWTLEAAIPWAALGVKPPEKSQTLRGDMGALESDQNGQTTVGRYYWANKRQRFLGDQPAEARVLPGTWGELEFTVPDAVDLLLEVDEK